MPRKISKQTYAYATTPPMHPSGVSAGAGLIVDHFIK
jgi:hypothetical protein